MSVDPQTKLNIALEHVTDEWKQIVVTDDLLDIFKQLFKTTPPIKYIFKWTQLAPLDKIKAVIVVDEPYTNGDADGLAISCRRSKLTTEISDALINRGLMTEEPEKFSLVSWARQGVLLLNKNLTTSHQRSDGSSHAFWGDYTQRIVNRLEKCKPNLEFFLYGVEAQKINCSNKHTNFDFFCKIHQKYSIDWNISIRTINMYTDGSCFPNNSSPDATAGYSIVIPEYQIIIIGKLDGVATNIRAEAMAILEAFRYYYKKNIHDDIVLRTDSKFWIDMIMRYMPKWDSAKFKSAANPDITKVMYKNWNIIKNYFKLEHIYAHGKKGSAGTVHGKWNEVADEAANYARKHLKKGQQKIVALDKFI